MPCSLRRLVATIPLPALTLLALASAPAAAAPPDPSPLTAQPSAQDFGVVPASWGEQTASVWVQNPGPGDVQAGAASVAGDAAFRVSGDGCAGQLLSPGQGCNVGVGFDPGDGGAYAATLHVSVAGFEDLSVPLSGVGGVQQVTLDPASLDFGTVVAGESVVRAFSLTSVGTLPFGSFVTIPSGGDVGAFRVERDGCSLHQLPTGVACEVAVRFTPPAAGAFSATLLLIGGDSDPAVVPLSGSAVAAAAAPAGPPPPPASPRAVADVAFDGPAGLPAAVVRGRVDLGLARCVGAPRCTVVVRARVYALAASGARVARGRRMASARTDVVLWRLRASGRRARLTLPGALRGTPALLVARLRTHADGHAVGARTLVVPLVAPRR